MTEEVTTPETTKETSKASNSMNKYLTQELAATRRVNDHLGMMYNDLLASHKALIAHHAQVDSDSRARKEELRNLNRAVQRLSARNQKMNDILKEHGITDLLRKRAKASFEAKTAATEVTEKTEAA